MKKIAIIISVVLVLLLAYNFLDKPDLIEMPNESYLVYEDLQIMRGEGLYVEGNMAYLSFSVIKDKIDQDIFIDEAEDTIIITSKNKVTRIYGDGLKFSINSKPANLTYPIKNIDGEVYLPVDSLKVAYDFDVYFFDETKVWLLENKESKSILGTILKNDSKIYRNANKKEVYNYTLKESDKIKVYELEGKFYKIRTEDGLVGYIEKNNISLDLTSKDDYEEEEIEKINLTWDFYYRETQGVDEIRKIPGIDIISPTWFSLTENPNRLIDKGSQEYVRAYNRSDIDVWALFDNGFDPDLTHQVLSSSKKREDLINNLKYKYNYYGLQGINVDFENVHLKTKDYFTQFLRELYPIFKEEGLYVSVDVTGISTSENWSLFYDRERINDTVDYVMVMAYDQFGAGSKTPGSVAEYTWVEQTIKDSLKYIDREKLVLSIPFYSRLWTIEGEKISSKSLTMAGVENFVNKEKIELIWDDEIKQYYGETQGSQSTYKLWVEDKKSLEEKVSLVHKYDLAGIASWRKGFEDESIWEELDSFLR